MCCGCCFGGREDICACLSAAVCDLTWNLDSSTLMMINMFSLSLVLGWLAGRLSLSHSVGLWKVVCLYQLHLQRMMKVYCVLLIVKALSSAKHISGQNTSSDRI